jgi:hypothetical protein
MMPAMMAACCQATDATDAAPTFKWPTLPSRPAQGVIEWQKMLCPGMHVEELLL